jgi:hypothetical protein
LITHHFAGESDHVPPETHHEALQISKMRDRPIAIVLEVAFESLPTEG